MSFGEDRALYVLERRESLEGYLPSILSLSDSVKMRVAIGYSCYMYPVLMDRLKLCTNAHSYDCSTMILSHDALPEEPNRSMIRSTDFV
jgi:hypothetical protein